MMFEELSQILLGSDVVELRLVDICCEDSALILVSIYPASQTVTSQPSKSIALQPARLPPCL